MKNTPPHIKDIQHHADMAHSWQRYLHVNERYQSAPTKSRREVMERALNVFVFVNVFAVYVFGMVVEEWMKELTFVSPYVPTHVVPIA